jgi:hypothetical protein
MPDKYDDNTKMPFGVFKGKKLANIPADYLLWLLLNERTNPPLKVYIEENIEVLRKEVINNFNTNQNGKQKFSSSTKR